MFLLSRTLRFIVHGVSPLRFVGPSATLIAILVVGYLAVAGKLDFSSLDGPLDAVQNLASNDPANPATTPLQPVSLDRSAPRSQERIRIATFNIQRFGEKKAADAEVMSHLAKIVASFDLVAIQEVQSPQAMPIAKLIELINRSGGRYDASVSEPIGHTTYREQYAFVWDTTRIRMIPDSAYMVRDNPYPNNRLHRPPMVGSFETRIQPVADRRPFRFTVINVHTDPDEVNASSQLNEMNVLDDVFIRVREYEYQVRQITNVLLVGDLNVSTANLGELGAIPGMISVVGTTPTNTAGTKTYDHILMDRQMTTEYTGIFGVIDYQQDYGLTSAQANRVSDHRPVWAEFSAYEMPPVATAGRSGNVR